MPTKLREFGPYCPVAVPMPEDSNTGATSCAPPDAQYCVNGAEPHDEFRTKGDRMPKLKESHKADVEIPFGEFHLEGELIIPLDAAGVVLFAHGSGSSRFSPRNQYVAHALHEHGVGTLLFDLLTK